MQTTIEQIYSFAEFEVNASKRRLSKNGAPVALNPKAFDLLLVLIEQRGQIVHKEELLETVWANQFVEENNLTVHISALRKIFGEKKGEHQFIATIPGKGYKFVAQLNEPTAESEIVIENHSFSRIIVDEEIEPTPPEVKQLAGRKPRNRQMFFALGGLTLLILAGIFTFRYFKSAPPTNITSLAVLPFANQNNDANTEYLSDGLSESVIYSLSQLPNLRVMSRNSVFRYKGRDADARTVGAELNVQAILTGRITQRGETLNVSAELISTRDNSVIWGEQFTRKMSDVEKLQTDIAASISDKLRIKFSGVKPQGTDSAEAYQLYLKGLYHWNKRTDDDLKQAVALFQQAIEKDPSYAKAYAGLAMTYNVLPGNTVMTNEEAADARFKAKATAQKALEFDQTQAEPHGVLGDQKSDGWDFAGAENHFKRAVELNPNFAAARQWYSELLSRLGRHDEALSEIKKAYELDPFSPAVSMNVALRYAAARRDDEAVAQFKKLIAAEPAYPMSYLILGDVYAEKEMFEDALEMWCKGDVLLKISPPEKCAAANAEIREALKKDGRTGFWRKILEHDLKNYEKGASSATHVAGKYARLGEQETAFEWLEKAFVQRERDLTYLKTDPAFDNVKSDARFGDLLKRIGLPQ